ncbi:MAG: response regulator [Candidatus Hodarchaeales archaeon]|jgi:PAS domain S-box-containing protein
MRILLVDDEPNFLDLGKLYLKKENKNFDVFTATSAYTALDMLEQQRFDVIISDYQMPELNGLGFLKTLRKQGNSIPFIIFTGRGREEVAIKALNLGASRYIQKGSDVRSQYAILAQAIQQEVHHWRTLVELKEREERFRTMANNIVNGLTILENHKRVYVNERVCEIYGYSKDEFLEINAMDLVAPQDREKIEKLTELQTTLGKWPHEVEVWIKRKDGSLGCVQNKYSISHNSNTGIDSVYVITTDITERNKRKKN